MGVSLTKKQNKSKQPEDINREIERGRAREVKNAIETVYEDKY